MQFNLQALFQITIASSFCLFAWLSYFQQPVLQREHHFGWLFVMAMLCGVRTLVTNFGFKKWPKVIIVISTMTVLSFVYSLRFATYDFPFFIGRPEPIYPMVGYFFFIYCWYYFIAEIFRVMLDSWFSAKIE